MHAFPKRTGAFAIAFYVVGYTLLLKRRTAQNIVWGGAAGCMPVLIGWSAVTVNGAAVVAPAAYRAISADASAISRESASNRPLTFSSRMRSSSSIVRASWHGRHGVHEPNVGTGARHGVGEIPT